LKIDTMESPKKLSCLLTSIDLQNRKATVLAELRKYVLEKKELNTGYAYKFSGSDEMIDLISDFIKSERHCCDFFSFHMHVQNRDALWLDITGPEGAKEFIKTELEL